MTVCLLFFWALEVLFSIFFVKPGACDFIERRVLEQKLSRYKSRDEIRIFFYGESTIQGDALYPKSTIDQWVSVYLDDLLKDTSKKIRVFNFGRLGCNSSFILRSFRETLPYQPDLAIFYSVHNDFVQLDNRHTNLALKPLRFGQKGYWTQAAREFVKQSAFLSETNRWYIRFKIIKHRWRDALREKGIDLPLIETRDKFYNPQYHAIQPNSLKFKKLFWHWKDNILRIIGLGKERGVSMIFLKGVSNFKDYHPNESTHTEGLTQARLEAWKSHFETASSFLKENDAAGAAFHLRRALRFEREHAMTYYRLGQAYEALGFYARANRCYLLANEKDRVPLRAPAGVRDFYNHIESLDLPGISIVKTQSIFENHSSNGIVDSDLVMDPTHPTVDGQALIALGIVKSMNDQEFFPSDWWTWDKLNSIELLKEQFDIDEDFQFEVYLKKACYIGRFYDKAVEFSKKALEIRPDSIEAKRSLAWAYWRKGETEKAMELYEELSAEAAPEMAEVFRKNPDLLTALASRGRRRAIPPTYVPHT